MSTPAEVYPWYAAIEYSPELAQGDLIDHYEIVCDFDKATEEAIFNPYNLIVVSQSCDIAKESFSHVALCPVLSFPEMEEEWPQFRGIKEKEELRKGNVVGFHMLNQCLLPGLEKEFQVVNFKRIFQANKLDLVGFVEGKKRLRLRSPYREHLAQAFARFFMRVGLPDDIPSFK